MAVSCQTVSLGHVLIDYAFGAVLLIVHGDPDDANEDGRDSVRSAAKAGGYCATKTTPLIKTLALRVQQPLMPAMPIR